MNRLFRSSVRTRVLSSRLGSLLLLFQRSPIVQMLFPEARVLGGAGLGELAKWTVATVAGLGAYDTVAGATTVSQLIPNSGSSNVTAAVGSSLSFTVQCTGAPGTPGSWTMSTVPPGLAHSNSKNSTTDSLSGIPTTEGTYSIIAKAWENSNFSGGSSSKTFTMTVGPAVITTPPASATISSGATTTLTVVASGSPLTYQWYQGASGVTTSPISGATSASYTTPSLTASTNYWVKVTRGTLTATTNPVVANSATAAVTVSSTPVFTTQPASTTINSGSTTTLNVVANGSPTYQWYIGVVGDTSNPIPGATSATYTTTALTATTMYWVRATNSSGFTNSTAALVTVNQPAAITTHPASVTINSGGTTTLSVVATGTAPLSYQWYQGSSPSVSTPVGTNSASFTTPALTSNTNYWVKVTNVANTSGALSNTATVTVNQPAAITTHPASTTINSGNSTTLSVVASGTGPFTYQWYQGSSGSTTTPVGSNSSSFTTPTLTADTNYWVKVTNAANTSGALSNTAAITVNQPAAITTHPASTTINSGDSTTLSVVASGTGPLTYQWYEGSSGSTTTPVGTDSANFTTPALTADTSYWVKVTNAANTSGALSNTAAITVNQPAAVTTHPASTTIVTGNSTTLTVAATGTGPLTYQWYQGSSGSTTTPVGTNSPSFTTPVLSETTRYWVKVTNSANASGAASNTATVTVNQILTIQSQPASTAINSGTSTTLNVVASGNNPLSYQWYEGETGITTSPVGTDSPSFSTPVLTSAATYWVRVTDALGFLDSSAATVSISVITPPVIANHPASVSLNSGSTTTLAVSITGSPSTFQWYLGNSSDTSSPIPLATAATFTTPALTETTRYWVRATNSAGNADSNTATVTVVVAPQITTSPASSSVAKGSPVVLSVVASGTSPAYQWYSATPNGSFNAIPGANSDTFPIASITGTTRFRVQVSNSAGSVDSDIATLTVITAPTIASQPQPATIVSGSTATLDVAISGSDSTYQWYQGNSGDTSNPVADATLSTFTTPPLTSDTTYWVRASNLAGTADSNAATVAVAIAPSITVQPASIAINRGGTTTLSVTASGTGPLSYQWYSGTPGITTSPLNLANSESFTTPSLNEQASYWVRVSNVVSHVDSNAAVVSINRFTLTTSGTHGTVTGAGTYDGGTSQTLAATPDSGYLFSGWSGDATGSVNPLTVTMDADKSIIATFGQDGGDSDSDGLTNFQEIVTYGTNPTVADTDGDGLKDGQEIISTHTDPKLTDSDSDGLSDANEDADGDGLNNLDEVNRFLTNPLLADSDSDGLSDAYAAAFVGTPIKPAVGNQISLNLRNLAATGNTLKLVGKLPKGLTFNATTGVISGIITATAGTYPLSVQILSGRTVLKTVPIPIVVLPFPTSLIGSFESLVENNNSLPIGALKITITAADTWSATLDSAGGARRTAKGKFVLAQGAPIAPITASFSANGSAPAMTFSVSLNGALPTHTGTYNGGTVRGFKIASGSENPGSTTLCNLVLDPGTQDGNTVPAGLGTLKGSFSNADVGTFQGSLGDGTATTTSIKLSTTGQAVLWIQPDKNKGTYLGGIVTLAGIGQPSSTSAKLTDRVSWAKAADAKALSYPGGFSAIPITVGSSRWSVPANATALGASLGWRNNRLSSVSISGGGLSNSEPQATTTLLPTEFNLDDSFNLVTSLPTGSPLVAWSGKVTSADGGFTGTLTLPAGFSTNVLAGAAAANGVLVQDDVWGSVTGCGLVKIPVAGIKGSFKTAAFVIGQ